MLRVRISELKFEQANGQVQLFLHHRCSPQKIVRDTEWGSSEVETWKLRCNRDLPWRKSYILSVFFMIWHAFQTDKGCCIRIICYLIFCYTLTHCFVLAVQLSWLIPLNWPAMTYSFTAVSVNATKVPEGLCINWEEIFLWSLNCRDPSDDVPSLTLAAKPFFKQSCSSPLSTLCN